jgi:DNA repair protein RecN (Recombination protein N)
MLEEIRIRDLGVIEEAHIELGPGLTVLTGETGAGKTMVLTALAMVLGQKVDASLVRTGAERSVCAATFRAPSALTERASEEFGADTTDGVVLARMLTSEGRSRALLGGASVPAGVLAEIGESLVSVHGQGSGSRLLRASVQRDLVDEFAGADLLALRAAHRRVHEEMRTIEATVASLTADREGAFRDAEELRAIINAVEAARPTVGEIASLQGEIARLGHVDGLIVAAAAARDALLGEDDRPSATSLIAVARKSTEQLVGLDPQQQPLLDGLLEILVRAEEVGHDLARYLDSLDADPRRLEEAQARLASLQTLLRRFGEATDDSGLNALLERSAAAGLRLLDLDGGDERLAELRTRYAELDRERDALADQLTVQRGVAAERLAGEVTAEIQALAMPHARFDVAVRPGTHGAHGRDEVEFLLAASGTAVPVAKGASGGELSRVMLGLEVIMAGADPVPTYIFDEVDAGVGGAAAIEVGRRLQKLASHAQVIVVTHLAQVAAFADAHYAVTKDSRGQVSSSTIRRLEGEERAVELARMMAGLSDSERAQASAGELLAFARREPDAAEP